MKSPIGVILAGGASTRMGQDKALMVIGGQTMAEWVADAMTTIFEQTVVVGRSESLAGLDFIADRNPDQLGPLNGVVAALATFERPIVAVAVDQPLVRSETLEQLARLAGEGTTALCFDKRPQVTCAAYGPSCLEEGDHQLRHGGSIQRMLTEVPHVRVERDEWSRWGEDGRSWFSLDTPADIVEAERRFRVELLG